MDGESTISGEKAGVQKRIRGKQPAALYTHYAEHSLNLVIAASSCSDPSVGNAIYHVKNLTLWIKVSAKRDRLLKAI